MKSRLFPAWPVLALGGAFSAGALLAMPGCTTAAPAAPVPVEIPTPSASLTASIRDLAPVEDESFEAFLARAEAVLLAKEQTALAAQVRALPRARELWTTPQAKSLAPSLVGAYARLSTLNGTLETLQSFVRHKTVNADDATAPGEGGAFAAMQEDLKTRAQTRGLSVDTKTAGMWLVGMPSAAEGTVPNLAASVGVLTHADVVPATESDWVHDPFAGIVKDRRMIARGALDDKGAIAAVLSALGALSATKIPLLRFPVLLVGTSEETHWAGIERFVETRSLPPTVIVADGSFPMGVGEKGITTLTLGATNDVKSPAAFALVSMAAGEVANQVPAAAVAVLEPRTASREDLMARFERARAQTPSIDVAIEDIAPTETAPARLRLTVKGRAAHSAEPELGVNAATDLVALLLAGWDAPTGGAPSSCEQLIFVLGKTLGRQTSAQGLGVVDVHPKFGPATANLGVFTLDGEGQCTAKVNLRWPPPRPATAVVQSACAVVTAPPNADITCKGGGLDPFLIDAESDVVKTLSAGYRAVYGKDPTPVTLAGTTYAKAINGAVTFGPEPAEDAGGRMHAANEFITLEELADLVEVYAFVLTKMAVEVPATENAGTRP